MPCSLLLSLISVLVVPVLSQAPNTAAPERPTTLGAVGIAVSSMEKSRDFYASTLGLRPTGMKFDLPEFSEIVMKLPGEQTGSAVVLMKYKVPKAVKDLPIKLVFYVKDVKATMVKMKTAGAVIVLEAGAGKYGNVTIPTAFCERPGWLSARVEPAGVARKVSGVDWCLF